MSMFPAEPDEDADQSGDFPCCVSPGAALGSHPMDSDHPMESGARMLEVRPSNLFRVTVGDQPNEWKD